MFQATSVAPESSVWEVAKLMGLFRQCQHQKIDPSKINANQRLEEE
jgi:hypothetical protein